MSSLIKAINQDKENKRQWIAIIVMFALLISGPIMYYCFNGLKVGVAKFEGKVNAGYYEDLIGEDYQTVEAHFKAAGFTDIELIDLNDSGLAFWNNEKVVTISIGGNMEFDQDDWFYPDTKVVISYH